MSTMSEKIKNILMKHRGKENAITAKRISQAMGFPMEDTQSVSRRAIWHTAEEYGLPLISYNKGYFIAQTDKEMEDYNSNYEKRIRGMRKTQKMANENYMRWKNGIQTEK